jgi:hypothetical protein
MEFKLPVECMECKKPIEKQGHVECLECGKECLPFALNQDDLDNTKEGEMVGLDVKSQCCKADVKLVNVRATCSDECHEKTYKRMEKSMGEFIYDHDPEGVLRKIPTRDIFEKGGLTMDELRAYPKAEIAGEA